MNSLGKVTFSNPGYMVNVCPIGAKHSTNTDQFILILKRQNVMHSPLKQFQLEIILM